MKIVSIIQARTNSTRLPSKVLMNLKGRTVLEHIIKRLHQSYYLDEIVVATTTNPTDNTLEILCNQLNTPCFRGSEFDVLSRYYLASKAMAADVIVRITSDCPLVDSQLLDSMLHFYLTHNYDFVTNAGQDINRTFPRGLDIEIFSFNCLKSAYLSATKSFEREHVTPYLYENCSSIFYYKNDKDFSNIRLTLDTLEDFSLIQKIYDEFYFEDTSFYLEDIINFLDENNKLLDLNKSIKQKKLTE